MTQLVDGALLLFLGPPIVRVQYPRWKFDFISEVFFPPKQKV